MEDDNTISRPTAREVPERFLVAFSLAGEQRTLVQAIAEAVEKEVGQNNVFYDNWYKHYIGGHDADLKLQKIYGEQCELAVACVSGHYGDKPWTQAEHEAIRARVMRARASKNQRELDAILPIRVGDGEVDGILFNTIAIDVRAMPPEETAQMIVDRLRLIAPGLVVGRSVRVAESTWPELPALLHWPIADQDRVREAFVSLLDREAESRFLPICGVTETGKTHITRQMLANGLRMDGLACGRFDFKGTTDMDVEMRAFVQDLDVRLPPSDRRLSAQLGQILYDLKRRARAALIILDTYEAAGDAQVWVEKQLLPSLIRAKWLRVVIAGQSVPKCEGVEWESVTFKQDKLAPPSALDWFELGKHRHHDLSLAFVEVLCRVASNKATFLAQILA